jgi:hypothetical protein
MSWWLAGVIGGVVAWLADYVMWSMVFTKGMEGFATMPADGKVNMKPMLAKSAALALIWGVLFAFVYRQFAGALWVQGGGPLAGMELASVLWLTTIALETVGGGVWYDKVRPLFKASFWAWFVRMNAGGLVVGVLLG